MANIKTDELYRLQTFDEMMRSEGGEEPRVDFSTVAQALMLLQQRRNYCRKFVAADERGDPALNGVKTNCQIHVQIINEKIVQLLELHTLPKEK